MFEYVNELAVVGTTFFMMAVAMIWYSPYLFQKQWMHSVGLTKWDIEKTQSNNPLRIAMTFVTYLIAIFLVALAVGYAQVFGLPVQRVAFLIALGFVALLAGFVIWEQRSLSYYLITAGFSSVFILGSSFLLYFWPW